MLAPTTSIQALTFVRIAWAAAYANSDPLDVYEVLVETASGTYEVEPSSCDGNGLQRAQILTNNHCDIPLTALRGAPFNLV